VQHQTGLNILQQDVTRNQTDVEEKFLGTSSGDDAAIGTVKSTKAILINFVAERAVPS